MALLIPRKCKDLSGQKIGRLTVLERDLETQFNYTRNHIYWKCQCDCGKIVTVRACRLNVKSKNKNQAHTRSCGCLQREIAAANGRKTAVEITPAKNIYGNYAGRARKLGLSFNISFEDFYRKSQEPCYYCGSLPTNSVKHKCLDYKFIYNGIDRINSDLGYIEGNMVTCCETCNKAKRDLTICEFINWINAVSKNVNKIKEYASCFNPKNSIS